MNDLSLEEVCTYETSALNNVKISLQTENVAGYRTSDGDVEETRKAERERKR